MLALLLHWYSYGEWYAIALVSVVVPLGFLFVYQLFADERGIADVQEENAENH